MKYEYKHPETGDVVEMNDYNTDKDFKELREKGYKLHKQIPETIEEEDYAIPHLKINEIL
jgi:hypothetical protein